MKWNWAKFAVKLTSRKLWMAVAAFVSCILMAFGWSESEVAQIVSIIMAGATAIAFIIGEGLVDAARESGGTFKVGGSE